ncbi:MAG: peptidoglycan-binding protein, partial [Desulfobacterales bacterium]
AEERAYYLVAKERWQETVQLGTAAVPALINIVNIGSLNQSKVAWALGEIGDARAIKYLKKLTKNRIKKTREAARQALQKIMQENSVAVAQRALADLGYDPGPSDGIMGKRTSDAIKKYQRDNNLQEDGHLTPSLLSKLQNQMEEKH